MNKYIQYLIKLTFIWSLQHILWVQLFLHYNINCFYWKCLQWLYPFVTTQFFFFFRDKYGFHYIKTITAMSLVSLLSAPGSPLPQNGLGSQLLQFNNSFLPIIPSFLQLASILFHPCRDHVGMMPLPAPSFFPLWLSDGNRQSMAAFSSFQHVSVTCSNTCRDRSGQTHTERK